MSATKSAEQDEAILEIMADAMFDCYSGYNAETRSHMKMMAMGGLMSQARRGFNALASAGYVLIPVAERDAALARAEATERVLERTQEALWHIDQWAQAYPVEIFPEVPKEDWSRINEVLAAAGLSLTRISASTMRHVVKGVGEIARAAIPVPATGGGE